MKYEVLIKHNFGRLLGELCFTNIIEKTKRVVSKTLFILFALIAFTGKTQPRLYVSEIAGYNVVPSGPTAIISFYNVWVKNLDSANFTDNLDVVFAVDGPPVSPADTSLQGFHLIPGNDSIMIDTVSWNVDTTFLKDGNNTVVIWPYGQFNPNDYDSSYFLVPIPLLAWSVGENGEPIHIKAGPVPANAFVLLQDPENILQKVLVFSSEGKNIPVPVNGKMLDVGHLPPGIYIMELLTSKGTASRKLIVER